MSNWKAGIPEIRLMDHTELDLKQLFYWYAASLPYKI